MKILIMSSVASGIRIQPTFALVRVVRDDSGLLHAYSMLGLSACSEAYEFGQLGTGLSWYR